MLPAGHPSLYQDQNMAHGINKVILVGRLGADPESKSTQGGMTVTSISLATTSARKRQDGQAQERTEWHRVKLFGKLGEFASAYLRKGAQAYVEGTIHYDKYKGKDGKELYFTEILANDLQLLGGATNTSTSAARQTTQVGKSEILMETSEPIDPFDDDPPF